MSASASPRTAPQRRLRLVGTAQANVDGRELEPQRILLAEDDLEMRSFVADALQRAGYAVVQARNGAELLERLTDWLVDRRLPAPFELVISDHRMPGFTGLGVLEGLREFNDVPPFIMITAFGGSEFAGEACRAGAAAVLDKPFEIRELLDLVADLIGPAHA